MGRSLAYCLSISVMLAIIGTWGLVVVGGGGGVVGGFFAKSLVNRSAERFDTTFGTSAERFDTTFGTSAERFDMTFGTSAKFGKIHLFLW